MCVCVYARAPVGH